MSSNLPTSRSRTQGSGRGLKLEPDDGLEPPLLQLLGHLLAHVAGVLVELDLGVAGHPEERGIDDLHAGEDRVQVVLEDVVQADEDVGLARSSWSAEQPTTAARWAP